MPRIRCNDTLPLCDIHNKQYLPCCGPDLFDPIPFYSVVGTCFRSVQLNCCYYSVVFSLFLPELTDVRDV